jgi:phospholipid/cholesterol/gamma-HCH transport system substrate-binding protein
MTSSKAVGAGAFVVIGTLLFTVALFMIGERRLLFTERYTVYTEFARLGQLENGAVVRVSGMDAGEVAGISIPKSPSEKFRVRMQVRKDMRQLVRTDSVATTQTEGLVGAIYVNIGAGTDVAPILSEGGTIAGKDPFQISELLQQASASMTLISDTVESLRGDAETAVKQIALTAQDAHGLVEDIRPDITAIARNGNKLTDDMQAILHKVNDGQGTFGKLVNDDGLYQQAKQIATETQAVMANVREVSAQARQAIEDFRSPDSPTNGLMSDMRRTLAQAREATADLADNMEAMKRNFLLRGFFNKRGYFDLNSISPAEYRKGVLENGKRKAMRIWLASNVLFATQPDGTEVLTADGRARIDSAIATYLRYLPTNPVVVEGYATGGDVGARYQRSRMRAGAVREYLLNQYQLTPQNTGSIALGEEAKDSPSNDRWDGVALTLFLDREQLQFATQPVASR